MRPRQGTRKESPSSRNTVLKKRLRERERKAYGEAKPPNLLIIALFGLAHFCLHFFPFLACVLKVMPLVQACTCNKQRKHKASRQAKENK